MIYWSIAHTKDFPCAVSVRWLYLLLLWRDMLSGGYKFVEIFDKPLHTGFFLALSLLPTWSTSHLAVFAHAPTTLKLPPGGLISIHVFKSLSTQEVASLSSTRAPSRTKIERSTPRCCWLKAFIYRRQALRPFCRIWVLWQEHMSDEGCEEKVLLRPGISHTTNISVIGCPLNLTVVDAYHHQNHYKEIDARTFQGASRTLLKVTNDDLGRQPQRQPYDGERHGRIEWHQYRTFPTNNPHSDDSRRRDDMNQPTAPPPASLPVLLWTRTHVSTGSP